MPDTRHALLEEDMEWLCERHSRSRRMFSLFGNDELENIEKLLERLRDM